MDMRQIDNGFFVCGQIEPHDIAELAERGFGGVISNRPDDEQEGQPSAASLRHAAEAAGIAFHHIPIVPGEATPADAAAMAAALAAIDGPVLGFCRTGQRAAGLYQAACADRR